MIIFSLIFWPRLFILGFAIFSWDLLIDAFSGWVVWVAGFFLLPWTTITYMMMWGIYSDGVYGVEWVFVGFRVPARPVHLVVDAATGETGPSARLAEPRRGSARAVASVMVSSPVDRLPFICRVSRRVQRTQSWSSRRPHCGLRWTPPTRGETSSIALGLKSGTVAA